MQSFCPCLGSDIPKVSELNERHLSLWCESSGGLDGIHLMPLNLMPLKFNASEFNAHSSLRLMKRLGL
jgi:hypothetical protein